MPPEVMSFWDHLDALRNSLIHMMVATLVASVAAFCFKDALFSAVLWPTQADFPTYRLLNIEPASIQLINTELTAQFTIHIRMAFVIGILAISPYLLFTLFQFIAPALYANERRLCIRLIAAAYFAFFIGLAISYLLLFPLSVRFLADYSVSAEVLSLISLSSYINTLLSLSLLFGLVFEMPVVAWLLGWAGMLKASWMRRYWRHAVVTILIAAAIITPTTDALTLIIVSLPILLLYEFSIWLVKLTNKTQQTTQT